MGAYINRDELLELYANTDDFDISDYDVKVAVIRQNILDMPTIDIVRCGECTRRKKNCFCLEHNRYERNDDGFCNYGERRADEGIIE